MIDLVAEGVDLSLRMGDMADSTAVARKIATGARCVVATPAYLTRTGMPQTPADLARHHALVYSQLGDTWAFRQGKIEETVTIRGRLRLSAAEGVRAGVLADMGLAVTTEWMFAPELASGAVQRELPEWTLPTIDLWAVYPSGRLATAKAKAFADFVERILI